MHCPLNAQGTSFARGPVGTQAAGGWLSKKSMQEKVRNAATHCWTCAGVLPFWGASSAFVQFSSWRVTQVARSP